LEYILKEKIKFRAGSFHIIFNDESHIFIIKKATYEKLEEISQPELLCHVTNEDYAIPAHAWLNDSTIVEIHPLFRLPKQQLILRGIIILLLYYIILLHCMR
jgi:hypothetical protein